jgi:hypothetical protein
MALSGHSTKQRHPHVRGQAIQRSFRAVYPGQTEKAPIDAPTLINRLSVTPEACRYSLAHLRCDGANMRVALRRVSRRGGSRRVCFKTIQDAVMGHGSNRHRCVLPSGIDRGARRRRTSQAVIRSAIAPAGMLMRWPTACLS